MAKEMNFHVAGPHNTTAWIAVFNHQRETKTRVETHRATMLVWAKDEDKVKRYVSGHYKRVKPEDIVCIRADPKHHLNQRPVVLNVSLPLLSPIGEGDA